MRLRPKFMTTDPLDLLMYSIEGCCLYSTNKTFKKIQSSFSFSLFGTTFISKVCSDINFVLKSNCSRIASEKALMSFFLLARQKKRQETISSGSEDIKSARSYKGQQTHTRDNNQTKNVELSKQLQPREVEKEPTLHGRSRRRL
jgi:hypothetical protein